MKITFISNACCVYEESGFRLLADPWLTPGAFCGSWFHYPPLKTTFEDLKSVDAIYISHIHPDHFDEIFLSKMNKSLPILILKEPMNLLRRGLTRLGFNNIIEVEDHERVNLGPFIIYFYAPFVSDPFSRCKIGNLIDSAIVVESRESKEVVFNANDNNPDETSAFELAKYHPRIDVAQIPYNAAGPYPHSFNLSRTDKCEETSRILKRNMEHMRAIGEILKAKKVMPFAGAYAIGGKQQPYFIRTISKFPKDTLTLSEGDTYDISLDKINYSSVPTKKLTEAYFDEIAAIRYPYEDDEYPDTRRLPDLLGEARKKLFKAQMKTGYFEDLTIYIDCLENFRFVFSMMHKEYFLEPKTINKLEPFISCSMDLRLLERILLKKEHWNNAEIGCHINFSRRPNRYSFDAHQMMSFFHI